MMRPIGVVPSKGSMMTVLTDCMVGAERKVFGAVEGFPAALVLGVLFEENF